MNDNSSHSARSDPEWPSRWAVVRSMTSAQASTTRALEDFVRGFDRDVDTDEEVRTQLERAIASHERIIEDLEFALAALEADEPPFRTESEDRTVDVAVDELATSQQ